MRFVVKANMPVETFNAAVRDRRRVRWRRDPADRELLLQVLPTAGL